MTSPGPFKPPSSVEDLDEPMRQLYWALFAYLRQQVGPSFEVKDLLRLARRVLDGMDRPEGQLTWEAARRAGVDEAKRQENLNVPLRIVVSVAELRDPQLVQLTDDSGDARPVESTCARFSGPSGESIWSLELIGRPLIDKVSEQWRRGGYTEVLCVPLALPVRLDPKRPDQSLGTVRCSFFLHVLDVRSSVSSLDFLGASDSERGGAQAAVDSLRSGNHVPRDAILDDLIDGLNVVGLDQFPLLEDILTFVVLQALSVGRLDHSPARLHGLIVGPPGQGKKLAGLAAKILNPVHSELAPSKVSVAGLVGAAFRTPDGWNSRPGAIPLASGGVAILQDAHAWDGALLKKIAPLVQEVIEDGVARDTVAGGIHRQAATSLLLDMNRAAHVGLGRTEAGLLRIRPVLSRLDTILEIPEDVARSWSVAADMYDGLRSVSEDLEQQQWVRHCRLLIATLRDRHPTIELEPVRSLMRQVHEEIRKRNESVFSHTPEAADIPARMVISFTRLVVAAARSRDSSTATADDVELASKFVNYKLDFLKMKGSASTVVGADGSGTRADWFVRYTGQEVRTQDVVQEYQAATGQGISERTVRRHLQRLGGLRQTKGTYLLPSPPQS